MAHGAGGKTASLDAATPSSAPSPQDRAERRQVTVMFSDLVGSTALSGRMDPEDLREVISAYQKAVADTVQRFGGFVAKYMGDGVLIYFGYPHAHEDDAERAVRSGLELVAAVGALKTHAPLQTRVGIATGLVVVGDLIGSGASRTLELIFTYLPLANAERRRPFRQMAVARCLCWRSSIQSAENPSRFITVSVKRAQRRPAKGKASVSIGPISLSSRSRTS